MPLCFDIKPPAYACTARRRPGMSSGAEATHGCCLHNSSSAKDMRRPSIAKPPNKQPCYVMSLRDPATRLESVVRYARQRGKRKLGGIWRTTQSFLDAFRSASAPQHREALAFYARSVAQPRYSVRRNTVEGGINGLVAQLDYLRGLNCSHAEVHFVCQERYQRDWEALLGTFRLDATSWNFTAALRQIRSAGGSSGRSWAMGGAPAADPALLDAANRAFVRECMYPFDTALWRQQCSI